MSKPQSDSSFIPHPSSLTIGVLGSGSEEHGESASAVGELLAELGVNLLTGGGGGVMRAVARAYTAAPRSSGISIGIIPCASIEERSKPKPGYPNEFVELPIHTHLPYSGSLGTDDLSRNHINILSCAALVALPGKDGTVSELQLATRYEKRAVAYSEDPELIRHFPEDIHRARSIEEVRAFLIRHLARHHR